ncbi:MurR/RpiR family transcriptional regulator [Alkalibacterium psychrotolerans]
MNIIEKEMNKRGDVLSKSDIQIVKSINIHYESIPGLKIQELANLCFTSTSTLHRIIIKLGFEGFVDLRYKIKENTKINDDCIVHSDNFLSRITNQLEMTQRLNSQVINRVAQAILESKVCYCYGTGWKQKQFVSNFSTELILYNNQMINLRTIDDLRIILENSSDEKLILIVSLGGDGKEYIDELKKHSLKNNTIVSLTTDSSNELASLSDYSLYYKSDSYDLKKHWSTITLNFLLDYLFECIISQSYGTRVNNTSCENNLH